MTTRVIANLHTTTTTTTSASSVIKTAPPLMSVISSSSQDVPVPGSSLSSCSSSSATPPAGRCKVCSGASTGVHYGVVSCEGCKAFFKRAVSQYNTSKCYFGGSCLITPETRGRCKACRLQRCLTEGMALDGTKVGRGRGLRSHIRGNVSQKPLTPVPRTDPDAYAMIPYQSGGGQDWLAPDHTAAAKSILNQRPEPTFMERQQRPTSRPLNVLQQTSDVVKRKENTPETRRNYCTDVSVTTCTTEDDERASTVGACLDRAIDKELQVYKSATSESNPVRFSFMSNYLALLAERNRRLEDTVGGVTKAVAFAYRGQIEDWTNFLERNAQTAGSILRPKASATIEKIVLSLKHSVTQDTDMLADFCRILPGFSELSPNEQRRRISVKYTVTWLLNRAPYVRNKELFTLLDHEHYGRYWMETLLDPQFVNFLFSFMEEVNALNLTLTENYLLMAVIILQPTSELCDKDSIRYVKFLYSHYLDALTHIFGSRRSGNFVQLRNLLMRAVSIDALHARYVSILDFSHSPVRPITGIEYSAALTDVEEEKEQMDESGSG